MKFYYLNGNKYLSLKNLYDDYIKTNTPGTTYKNFVKRYRKGMSIEDAISLQATRASKTIELPKEDDDETQDTNLEDDIKKAFDISQLNLFVKETSNSEVMIGLTHISQNQLLISTELLIATSKELGVNTMIDINNVMTEKDISIFDECFEPLTYSIKIKKSDYEKVRSAINESIKKLL